MTSVASGVGDVGEIYISEMSLADLEEVLEVEHTSFLSPWSKRAFFSELTENLYADYVVARIDDQVVGYAGMWLILDEAHITNIAVHKDYRGQGIGERLLQEIFVRARARGARRMTLEVRVSNMVARHLYEKMGFVPRGVRKGYYADTKEDAIIMWKEDLAEE